MAALAAPYRHTRLSAVKLNKDAIAPRAKASMDELRAEMQKHLEILAPVLDLEGTGHVPTEGGAVWWH